MGFKQLSGAFGCGSLFGNGPRFALQVRHSSLHKPSAGFPLQSGSRPAYIPASSQFIIPHS